MPYGWLRIKIKAPWSSILIKNLNNKELLKQRYGMSDKVRSIVALAVLHHLGPKTDIAANQGPPALHQLRLWATHTRFSMGMDR